MVRRARDAIEGRAELARGLQADHLAVLFFVGEAEGLATQVPRVVRILFRRLGYVEEAIPQRVRAETRQDVLESWYEEALNVIDESAAQRLVEHIRRSPPPVS